MDVALQFGFVGIFILIGLEVMAYAQKKRPIHDAPTDWREKARTHLPYANLREDEIHKIYDRDDFKRKVELSAEREWSNARGPYTPNEIGTRIKEDITNRTKDILMPEEIKELAEMAEHNALKQREELIKKRKAEQ